MTHVRPPRRGTAPAGDLVEPAPRGSSREAARKMMAKLDLLIADPMRKVLEDPAFIAHTSRQFARVFPGALARDATGRQTDSLPVVADVEPFRPRVRGADLRIARPVGAGGENGLRDLVGIKKGLADAGFYNFDVTREASDVAGPRFVTALKHFQRAAGVKADGLLAPGGPTLAALKRTVTAGDKGGAPADTRVAADALGRGKPAPAVVSDRAPRKDPGDEGRRDQPSRPIRPEAQHEVDRARRLPNTRLTFRFWESRIWAIRNNRLARFNIKDNPRECGDPPFYRQHAFGVAAIRKYKDMIEREARAQGVDPNLVRAVMYVENADGTRFGFSALADRFKVSDTLFPMNINPVTWAGMGGVKAADFVKPDLNIRASVALLKAIRDRIDDPTPEKIGSIWNFTGREVVSSVGARIGRAFRERLWQK